MRGAFRSFDVLWRTENLIIERKLGGALRGAMLLLFAGLIGLFGLLMFNVAIFFYLSPDLGQAAAALIVGVGDVVLAALLLVLAAIQRPERDLAPLRDVRAIALKEVENEMGKIEDEYRELRAEVRRFVRHPGDVLLPTLITPVIAAVSRAMRKSPDD